MGGLTNIGWTDLTVNPWTWRCAPVAPECWRCYSWSLTDWRQGVGSFLDGPPVLKPGRLLLPFLNKEMRAGVRAFLTSMTDPFHPGIPKADQARVWAMMAADRRHEYQVLSKRPAVGRKLLNDAKFPGMVRDAMAGLIGQLTPKSGRLNPVRREAVEGARRAVEEFGWPLRNVLVGVSAGSQESADKFMPDLMATQAAVRFVSVEPMIGETDLSAWLVAGGLDWVIIGGESGTVYAPDPLNPPLDMPEPNRLRYVRPMLMEWAGAVMDQCETAGVPVYCKQLGSVQAKLLGLSDFKGEQLEHWPASLDWFKTRQHQTSTTLVREAAA